MLGDGRYGYKWYTDSAVNGRSWIKIDFKQQLSFCAIAARTANDFKVRDPKKFEFFIATPNNKWKHIQSINHDTQYKRDTPIITYLGH